VHSDTIVLGDKTGILQRLKVEKEVPKMSASKTVRGALRSGTSLATTLNERIMRDINTLWKHLFGNWSA